MKRPAFQFYPSDWRSDAALQSCSIAARGLWWELCCVMHECSPYGHLTINGGPMPDESAARLVGVTLRDFRKLVAELEAAGVPSRTADGALFSRRMVRDEHVREVRAASGRLGGNPCLLNQKDNPPDKPPPNQGPKVEPTPSSSSSSSKGLVEGSSSARATADPEKTPGDKSPSNVKPLLPKGWASTPQGTDQAGALLGLRARKGESYPDYRARIFAHLDAKDRAA